LNSQPSAQTLLYRFNSSIEANLFALRLRENKISSQIINTNTADLYNLSAITHDLYIPADRLTLSRKLLKEHIGHDALETENIGLKPKSILIVLGLVLLIGLLVAFANEKIGIFNNKGNLNVNHLPSY